MSSELVFTINNALRRTKSPPIPLAGAWGARYEGEEGLINLAQGVPGTPPPMAFLQKLAESAEDPLSSGYGDLRGDEELRTALAGDVERTYGDRVSPEDEIVITAGANLGFYSAMVSLAGAGDEVVLPTP